MPKKYNTPTPTVVTKNTKNIDKNTTLFSQKILLKGIMDSGVTAL